jgi:FtsP/CotA-like multicopper oxidase with cupredoxin domain
LIPEVGAVTDDFFPTGTDGLSEVVPPSTLRLRDGDHIDLRIAPVTKHLGGDVLRMLAYDDSIPGPTLHVDQGSELTVHVTNDGDLETTVHWHGLRVENQYDGVPFETQAPIPIGGTYAQKIRFPDAGFYWYHPHIREDYGLELGLYGTIIVEPSDPSYWPPADRSLTITLDDLLVEDGKVAPFRRSGPTYTAMGRFGNVMLINGDLELSAEAAVGEVVRLYLVNTANTRIFNVGLDGARMKLVGADSGRCEFETFVDAVLLAPSERAIVDVLFETPGAVRLEHRTPDRIYDLGTISVTGTVDGDAAASFEELRRDAELGAAREQLEHDLRRSPDKVLAFWSEMPLLYGDDGTKTTSETAYHSCPMHPDVAASFAGTCPNCGMKLVAADPDAPTPVPYVCPMHDEIDATWAASCPLCGMTLLRSEGATDPVRDESVPHDHEPGGGIEWEDDMVAINRETNTGNMIWQLIDRETGATNADISWKFTVGDRVKIRLINEMGSDHPMPHPFHVHGAGRFLVISRDGVTEPNLAWKDTVLLLAGQTVDILLHVTNPGLWMAHCHIAEHNQSGMMFSFDVAPAAAPSETT